MKAECQGEKIKEAISKAERITGKNLALPVLSSILCIATEKSLKFRSTNLSLGIEIEIPAKISKEGAVAITGSTLASFFSSFQKNESVTLEQKDDTLFVTTKNNKVVFKTQNYDDFPNIPEINGKEFIIPAKSFGDGLKSVSFSASFSDIKPEISSVYIYSDNGYLIFVSTDSFRLAEKRIKIKDIPDAISILIPLKNVIEILRVLPDENSDLTVKISKNQISLISNGFYLTSHIIDGVFPDYKQIIPKESTTTITALRSDLLQALKISNIFSDKFNQITFLANPLKKLTSIYAKNSDIGENTTNINANLTGEKIEMNFNFKYFFECFQVINKESVQIKSFGANKPLIITGVGDNSFLYLVMPMNR